MMRNWLADLAEESFATAVIWTVAALILLVVILVLIRIVRNLTGSNFVAGGRSRAPRLAVIDAAVVDNQRRLVLVRRDDVEHLILIGGPTDVVVEQHIRTSHPSAQPAQRQLREPPAPPVPPRPAESAQPRSRPAPAAPARPEPAVSAPERGGGREAPRRDAPIAPPLRADTQERVRPVPDPVHEVAPQRQESPRPATPVAPVAPPWRAERAPEQPRGEELDASLLEEIDRSVGEPRGAPAPEPEPRRQEPSIEDEMSRLLDDLSDERRKGS